LRDKVERTIKLSAEKYCSASAMLAKTATITHDFEVVDTGAQPATFRTAGNRRQLAAPGSVWKRAVAHFQSRYKRPALPR